MDKLYASILSKCPWRDRHFVRRYRPCLGAVVALKRPLSISAIEMLLDDDNARTVFRPLCSLLIGAMSRDRPVQIAHPSLRDYVTRCHRGEIMQMRGLRSRRLITANTWRCAASSHLIASFLSTATTSPLFLTMTGRQKYPSVMDGVIPEHVWYACEHWMDHLQDVKVVSDELQNHWRILWIGAFSSGWRSVR